MTPYKKYILNLINIVVGRKLEYPKDVPFRIFFEFYLNKGLRAFIRGFFYWPFMGKAGWPLYVGSSARIKFGSLINCGTAVYIGDYVRIDALSRNGITLGDRVSIREWGILQLSSHLQNLGDEIIIGDDVYIGPFAFIGAAAKVTIGARTLIGPRITIIAENHIFSGESPVIEQGVTRRGVSIGDECWIGANVTIIDGVSIGRNCIVGAGAIVTKSIPDNAIAYGNPAKVIRYR